MKNFHRPRFARTARKIVAEVQVRRTNVVTKIIPVHFKRCFRIVEIGDLKIAERIHRRRTVGVRTNYGATMSEAFR